MKADPLARLAPEHRLLLQAALGPPPVATKAWLEWRHRVEFDGIDSASQRLLPLIARRDGVIPMGDPVHGRVRGLYRRTWVRHQSLWAGVRPALEALGQRRIPLLVVGEAALVCHTSGGGSRPIQELTMAIEPRRQADAVEAMTQLGWRPQLVGVRRQLRWRLLRSGGSWGFTRPGSGRAAKHLRLCFGAPWAVADPMAWQGAHTMAVAGTVRQLQQPGDLLLQLTLEARRPCKRMSPQWIADVVQLLRNADPEALVNCIRTRSCHRRVLMAFHSQLTAAGELVDDPAPAALLAQLVR
jgi:hypothetical protein